MMAIHCYLFSDFALLTYSIWKKRKRLPSLTRTPYNSSSLQFPVPLHQFSFYPDEIQSLIMYGLRQNFLLIFFSYKGKISPQCLRWFPIQLVCTCICFHYLKMVRLIIQTNLPLSAFYAMFGLESEDNFLSLL